MLMIFDFDGVVVDSMNLHTWIEAQVFNRYGIAVSAAELVERFAGVPFGEMQVSLEDQWKVRLPEAIEQEVERSKVTCFTQKLKAIPGIESCLREIATRTDMQCAIASGSSLGLVRHALEIVNLESYFGSRVFSSEMVTAGKPAPDIFHHTAKECNVDVDECIVVEDGVSGVLAACSAGMLSFGFVGGEHCGEKHADRLLKAGAAMVFGDMQLLPFFL